jgi:hypothetical protein
VAEIQTDGLAGAKNNIHKSNDVEVKIGTVHSVKGKTHSATLYMESFYQKDGSGANAKSYESERLKKQFNHNTLSSGDSKRVKQSAKMVYVGFSRPINLLCFAVHKDRFNFGPLDDWVVVG